MPFNTLCVRSSIFERSRCQCSVRRNDFIYFDLRGLVARQSEQFCTYFSPSRTKRECGKPYRRALQKSNEDEKNACKFVLPKKKRCMHAQFFFSEFFVNMHIASDTIFTIEGLILWPYSSQVTSSPCAKTVPRVVAVNIRFIKESKLLRTAKEQSKKSASKLSSSPDDVTFKIPLRDFRIKKKKRNIKGHLSL